MAHDCPNYEVLTPARQREMAALETEARRLERRCRNAGFVLRVERESLHYKAIGYSFAVVTVDPVRQAAGMHEDDTL